MRRLVTIAIMLAPLGCSEQPAVVASSAAQHESWGYTLGDVHNDGVAAIAADDAGVVIAGHNDLLGADPSLLVQAYAPDGAARWGLARLGAYRARAIAVHGSEVFVAGDRGDAGAVLSVTEGEIGWEELVTATGRVQIHAVAAAPERLAIAGSVEGALDGGVDTGDLPNAFVALMTRTGELSWLEILASEGHGLATSVAFVGDDVVVGGRYDGAAAVGGVQLEDGFSDDAFVMRLGSDGTLRWVNEYPGSGADLVSAIVVNDDIVVTGAFSGNIDLGAGLVATAECEDVFVLRLDDDGNHVASQTLGGLKPQIATSLALAGDVVVVAGQFVGRADFGQGTHDDDAARSAFVVMLDNALFPVSSQASSGGVTSVAHGVALIDGEPVIVGDQVGDVVVGPLELTAQGARDGFIARLGL